MGFLSLKTSRSLVQFCDMSVKILVMHVVVATDKSGKKIPEEIDSFDISRSLTIGSTFFVTLLGAFEVQF